MSSCGAHLRKYTYDDAVCGVYLYDDTKCLSVLFIIPSFILYSMPYCYQYIYFMLRIEVPDFPSILNCNLKNRIIEQH